MSDTPETDHEVTVFDSITKHGRRFECSTGKVSAEFARNMERERNKLREELDSLLDRIIGGSCGLTFPEEALAERNELKRQRDNLMFALSKITETVAWGKIHGSERSIQ